MNVQLYDYNAAKHVIDQGGTFRQAIDAGCPAGSYRGNQRRIREHVRKWIATRDSALAPGTNTKSSRPDLQKVLSNKKHGKVNWRDWSRWAEEGQQLKKQASLSQDEATWSVPDAKEPVAVMVLLRMLYLATEQSLSYRLSMMFRSS